MSFSGILLFNFVFHVSLAIERIEKNSHTHFTPARHVRTYALVVAVAGSWSWYRFDTVSLGERKISAAAAALSLFSAQLQVALGNALTWQFLHVETPPQPLLECH